MAPLPDRAQLRTWLFEHLDEYAGSDENARRRWLAHHLELYVSRWQGFMQLPTATGSDVRRVPGFDMIAVAIEAGSPMFEGLPAWAPVRAAFDRVVGGGGRPAASDLYARVAELKTATG